jgi:hypothetical protein
MTGLNRSGFYRWRVPPQATPVEMEIRDQMQRVALEWPTYGYRRITAELRPAHCRESLSNPLLSRYPFSGSCLLLRSPARELGFILLREHHDPNLPDLI